MGGRPDEQDAWEQVNRETGYGAFAKAVDNLQDLLGNVDRSNVEHNSVRRTRAS